MTKDEAREILDIFNAWRKGYGDDFPYEAKQISQAIDCAIQALGDGVCQKCGDTGIMQGDYTRPEGIECDACKTRVDYERLAGKYGVLLNDIEGWLSINTQPTISELTKMRKSIREILKPKKP